MEQLVARWAHNPKVTGSSPVPATKEKPDTFSVRLFVFTQRPYHQSNTIFKNLLSNVKIVTCIVLYLSLLTKKSFFIMKKSVIQLGFYFITFLLIVSCTPQPKDISNEIKEANKKFMEAFNASDANTLTMCYTDNAKLFPANSEIIEGHDAINKFWAGAMKMGIKKAKLETVSATSYGNTAIEEGKYSLFADNDQPIDQGKYIVTWEKINREWKIKQDIWNTNYPSIEKNYKRLEGNFIIMMAAGINYAKKHKESVSNYGKYVGDLIKKGWRTDGKDNLTVFLNGFKSNMKSLKSFKLEILEQDNSHIKAKMAKNWYQSMFFKNEIYGVTSNDLQIFLENIWIQIADQIGLIYAQKIEDNEIAFTVTKK